MADETLLPRLFAGLLALGLLAGCSSSADENSTTPAIPNVRLTKAQRVHVELYTVVPVGYRQTVQAPGTVDFDNDQATSVVSPFTGPVTRIFVALGQHVVKGQPMAAVASADVANAVAAYRKAAVAAANARRVAAADRDLAAHNGISEREAAQAETDAASAEADRVAALQALQSLGASPASGLNGIIRAPVSGVIADKTVTPGQLLQAGSSTAFTVANLSQVWVLAQLAPDDLSKVGFGDAATINPGNGTGPFHGTVQNIGSTVDPNTRAIVARIVAPNPGDLLKKQMYVDVAIQSGRVSTGLLVPVSAVLHDDENLPFVYIALPDGSFARRHVTLGYRDSQNYDVTSGLASGDRIVSNGALFLQFMQSQ
jgi:membrane fusion protein, heavy metal efflux system